MSDSLDFAGHEFARASLDHCVKCTICETVCPVRGGDPAVQRAQVRRPAGRAVPQRRTRRPLLDYCSSCGACTLAASIIPFEPPVTTLNPLSANIKASFLASS